MLRQTREAIIQSLWKRYRDHSPTMQQIEIGLRQQGITEIILDHFAIIDLPGPHTGMTPLSELFQTIGYIKRGQDYLEEKQNDFLWLAEADSLFLPAREALPQVVVADFRLEALPLPVRHIIEKYASLATTPPLAQAHSLAKHAAQGETDASIALCDLICNYLTQREWPLPSLQEFRTVHAFNKLLAWVLVFGHQPNHFTLSLHHQSIFNDIESFHNYIENELNLTLNDEGGKIKGSRNIGIMQGSTVGLSQTIHLSDGEIELPTGFIEFVWRYPINRLSSAPTQWNDYFTGFIPAHANRVIESLTVQNKDDILCEVQG